MEKKALSMETRSKGLWKRMVLVMAAMLAAEGMIMLLFSFLPRLSAMAELGLDVLFLFLFSMPVLYFALYLPLKKSMYELEEAAYRALHDDLTGLPKRTLFADRLSHEIEAARRNARPLTLISIDPGSMTKINKALGYRCGNEILKQIGERLRKAVRKSDAVARVGGDEFSVLLVNSGMEQCRKVGEKIHSVFETPFRIGEESIGIEARLGIAVYPTHADQGETLMHRAYAAMRQAKEDLKSVAVFDKEYESGSLERLTLYEDLRCALHQGGLQLVFQPKVELESGRVVSAEALIRWPGERGRPVAEFMPLAEQTGLIGPLSFWVLEEAVRQCAEWRNAGLDACVAANLSVRNLLDPNLPARLGSLIVEYGLNPARLTLEVTESTMMRYPERSLKMLAGLHAMGHPISIDDFGTGYSSLSYLRRLPAAEMKIDMSFIRAMPGSEKDERLVQSIIEIGHSLGIRVVAEGVESEEVMNRLLSFGCEIGQGYYFSKPLPAGDFIAWCKAWKAANAGADEDAGAVASL